MSNALIQVGNVDQRGHNSLWGRVYSPSGISSTLNANGGGMGAKTGLYAIPCAIRGRNSEGKIVQQLEVKEDGIMNSLTTVQKDAMVMSPSLKRVGVVDGCMIRRLTPFETFRLQGVKKEDIRLVVSDTQAYRISGNAISVNVMQALLQSIYKKELLEKTSLFDF